MSRQNSLSSAEQVRAAEVVLPCTDLDATLAFFAGRLGFRIDCIAPADDPSVATMSGHGLRIRLERGRGGPPGTLRLLCREPAAVADGATELTAPNGTRIELAEAEPAIVMPDLVPSLVVTRSGGARPATGRAGMLYRDLIPDRQGGRFIASHIQIPDGGPVPDYVHYHRIRFQMIYCRAGWVRVVYEDQGPPLVLHAGDCVLQPPRIRHRVLDSSPGLEVIELASPARHETTADHDLALPTSTSRPERDFGGQRFVHHRAAGAEWQPWRPGLESRDLGIAEATGGMAAGRVVRRTSAPAPVARTSSHDGELFFLFLLEGAATLACEGQVLQSLAAGDSLVVPAGLRHAVGDFSDGIELLEVTVPADLRWI